MNLYRSSTVGDLDILIMKIPILSVVISKNIFPLCNAFTPSPQLNSALEGATATSTSIFLSAEEDAIAKVDRRNFLAGIVAGTSLSILTGIPQKSLADGDGSFSVDDFLRSGQVSMPMGVSGQAGKSKPETGIVFRDGSELSRDTKSGNVLTEILLNAQTDDPIAVVTTFSSPWPLAKGSVYDIECRDSNTGEGVFLSVSDKAGGKALSDLPNSFFLDKLFSPTGRFSFYGPPTDIKVRKSYMDGNNRILEIGFSILSQSTGTEIPRNAIVAATIPDGTDEAVMLVGSSTTTKWKKGTEASVRKTVATFRAIPAPKSSMKVRAKVPSYQV